MSYATPIGYVEAGHLDAFIERCDAMTLAQVDVLVRTRDGYSLQLPEPRQLLRSGASIGELGFASFNRDGRVREKAVRRLAAASGVGVFPFLILRLNDWVKPIRDIAADGIRERLRSELAGEFVSCLPLLARLERQRRGDHDSILNDANAFLQLSACRSALVIRMRSSERSVRRAAFSVLMRGEINGMIDLLGEAITSPDEIIRFRAAKAARTLLDRASGRALLASVEQDRFMPTRREALLAAAERGEISKVRTALLDSHASIRDAARSILRGTGDGDFASFYRSLLDHGSPAAIAGLGETGTADDVAAILRVTNDGDPKARRAAVRAVARLDIASHAIWMRDKLDDPRSSVARAAYGALAPHVLLREPADLWEIILHAQHPHARRLALSLISRGTWWDTAEYLVLATGGPDKGLRDDAAKYLERWRFALGRSVVRPSTTRLDALKKAVARRRAELGRDAVNDLESVIAYAER